MPFTLKDPCKMRPTPLDCGIAYERRGGEYFHWQSEWLSGTRA